MSWRRGQTVILTQSSSRDHSSTSSSSWLRVAQPWVAEGPKPLSLQADSHDGILSPTLSNRLCPGYIIVYRPPAPTVLPLIYTGSSLDWRLGRGSIYNSVKGMSWIIFAKLWIWGSITCLFSRYVLLRQRPQQSRVFLPVAERKKVGPFSRDVLVELSICHCLPPDKARHKVNSTKAD